MIRKFRPNPNVFPLGAKVFLPHLIGKDPQLQIDAARILIQLGYTPVVHFGARNFENDNNYVKLIRAHSENGVTHGLFLGGNPLNDG